MGRLYLVAMPGRTGRSSGRGRLCDGRGSRSSSAWPSPRRSAASLPPMPPRSSAGRPVPGRVVPRRRLRCARRSRGVLGARLPRGEAADGGRAGGDPLRGGDRADGDARGVRAPRPRRAARAGRAGGIGRRVPSGDRRAARARARMVVAGPGADGCERAQPGRDASGARRRACGSRASVASGGAAVHE